MVYNMRMQFHRLTIQLRPAHHVRLQILMERWGLDATHVLRRLIDAQFPELDPRAPARLPEPSGEIEESSH